MIYFDNAATSKYKPFSARHAAARAFKDSANPGRGSHKDSINGAITVQETRSAIASYLHAGDANVIFTKNCTEALNLAILGTAKPGGHVITTTLEHNSVLRPLYMLQKEGLISLTIIEPDQYGITAFNIENAIKDKTYLVAVTSMSNVTGYTPPLREIGSICKKRGITFLVDGAQGIGHTTIDSKEMNIDIICGAGHKALHGMQGTGFLLYRKGIFINPIMYGGTGTESDKLRQPSRPPESLESGTLNLPGIAALNQAVKWTEKHQTSLNKSITHISEYLYSELCKMDEICLHSVKNAPIVTFSTVKIDCDTIANQLNEKYDIAVRYGLHCAPLAIGREKSIPSVRISIDANNTLRQARYLVRALKEILRKGKSSRVTIKSDDSTDSPLLPL